MARRRHTPDQATGKLCEGENLLNEGTNISEACKHLEVSAPTFRRWQAQYGGVIADDARRLKKRSRIRHSISTCSRS